MIKCLQCFLRRVALHFKLKTWWHVLYNTLSSDWNTWNERVFWYQKCGLHGRRGKDTTLKRLIDIQQNAVIKNLSNPCGTWRLEKALLLKLLPSKQIAPSCHFSMPQPCRKLSKDSGLLEGRNPGLIIVGVDASMMTGPLYRVRTVAPQTHTKMPSTLACPLLCLNWTSSILEKVERST